MRNDYLKIKDNTAWRTIEGTTYLINPSTKKIFPLDEAGRVIWDSLGEKKDCESLAEIIYNEFDVELETAKKDIREFTEQLLNEGLIEKVS